MWYVGEAHAKVSNPVCFTSRLWILVLLLVEMYFFLISPFLNAPTYTPSLYFKFFPYQYSSLQHFTMTLTRPNSERNTHHNVIIVVYPSGIVWRVYHFYGLVTHHFMFLLTGINNLWYVTRIRASVRRIHWTLIVLSEYTALKVLRKNDCCTFLSIFLVILSSSSRLWA